MTLALFEREQFSDEFAFAGLRGLSEKPFCVKMMRERAVWCISTCFACLRHHNRLEAAFVARVTKH